MKRPDDNIIETGGLSAEHQAIKDRLTRGMTEFGEDSWHEDDVFLALGEIPDEVCNDPEVQETAKIVVSKWIGKRNPSYALEIIEKLKIPAEVLRSPEMAALGRQALLSSNSHFYKEIVELFKFDKGFLNDPELIQAAKKEFTQQLSFYGGVDIAFYTQELFEFPSEFVEDAASKAFHLTLRVGNVGTAVRIKERFNINEAISQDEARICYVVTAAEEGEEGVDKLKEEFKIKETLKEAAPRVMLDLLRTRTSDEYSDANENTDQVFHVLLIQEKIAPKIDQDEFTKEFPAIGGLIDSIKSISPALYNQIKKSDNLFLNLFSFINAPNKLLEIIEQNPFLTKVTENNIKYGSRLLIAFPKFNEESRECIKEIFRIKADVVAANPGIDENSPQFRALMQVGLLKFKNNLAIFQEVGRTGIDVDAWVDYEQTKEFELKIDDSRTLSDKLSTPFNRIGEAVDFLVAKASEWLSQFESELRTIREHPDTGPSEVGANDVSLWDAFQKELSNHGRMKGDVLSAYNKFAEAEKRLDAYLLGSNVKAKEVGELKAIIGTLRKDFRAKFDLLAKEFSSFEKRVYSFVGSVAGSEEAEANRTRIRQETNEQFIHVNEDTRTISELLSSRGDVAKKLAGSKMKVSVWARNPDIDLYQGNYSPCCISIESGAGGNKEDSAISKYITDIGIQVVSIYDTVKNIPVTAAWCWLGKDKDGNAAIVVDNIEANMNYSLHYTKQLGKELMDYLIEYAKSVGVKKIVLGKANNDLPTMEIIDSMRDDEVGYKKLGGFNSEKAYYLEAHEKEGKVVWEK